ncbi:MAG: hypothetical protein LBM98_10995 [Oscillospiraceae bacterium]|nr:hypothetical protein [Oscillospiraceae bacterium]
MRYVVRLGAKQSSAAVRRYVCCPPGTGLLRTCNVLRIAGLPVLRKDGQGVRPAPAHCAGTKDEGFTNGFIIACIQTFKL